VLRYSSTPDISKVVQISEKLEQQPAVVINLVPEHKLQTVRQELTALFNKAGIKVLGILPEVRSLLGVSVRELAEVLGGEVLASTENTDEIVENVMVGAMTLDSGVAYFNRKKNKAAVIRGERADMQLAALETSSKCLILTNDVKPLPPVISQAQEKRVPIIILKQDTSTAITDIEKALTKASFRNSGKLETFGKVLDGYFDFKALYSELGLKA
jgi:hypothetical protein